MERQIGIRGAGRWEGSLRGAGKAQSDLSQISAEAFGVHPVVTLTGDSSAVSEFNLRSTNGIAISLLD